MVMVTVIIDQAAHDRFFDEFVQLDYPKEKIYLVINDKFFASVLSFCFLANARQWRISTVPGDFTEITATSTDPSS